MSEANERMAMERLILVLFTGHVGSSWVTSMLASHSAISQLGFEPADELTEAGLNAVSSFDLAINSGELQHLERRVYEIFAKKTESADDTPSHAWGFPSPHSARFAVFKARLNLGLQRDFFLSWLPEQNPYIVLLRRKNKIKNAVSQFKRTQLSISHLRQLDAVEAKRRPVRVDPDYILRQAQQFTLRELRSREYFKLATERWGLEGIEVCYEDLLGVDGLPQLRQAVCGALGLETEPLKSDYRKMTRNSLLQAVKNYLELVNVIQPTFFSKSLMDDEFDVVEEIARNVVTFEPYERDGEVQGLRRLRNS